MLSFSTSSFFIYDLRSAFLVQSRIRMGYRDLLGRKRRSESRRCCAFDMVLLGRITLIWTIHFAWFVIFNVHNEKQNWSRLEDFMIDAHFPEKKREREEYSTKYALTQSEDCLTLFHWVFETWFEDLFLKWVSKVGSSEYRSLPPSIGFVRIDEFTEFFIL